MYADENATQRCLLRTGSYGMTVDAAMVLDYYLLVQGFASSCRLQRVYDLWIEFIVNIMYRFPE